MSSFIPTRFPQREYSIGSGSPEFRGRDGHEKHSSPARFILRWIWPLKTVADFTTDVSGQKSYARHHRNSFPREKIIPITKLRTDSSIKRRCYSRSSYDRAKGAPFTGPDFCAIRFPPRETLVTSRKFVRAASVGNATDSYSFNG